MTGSGTLSGGATYKEVFRMDDEVGVVEAELFKVVVGLREVSVNAAVSGPRYLGRKHQDSWPSRLSQ